MAIVIRGQSICRISGRTIHAGDEIVMFQAFVYNEADPLFFFSDGAFLEDAFLAHPMATAVQARYEDHLCRTGPGHRICGITGKEILDPEEHVEVGHLTEDSSDPLFGFNYMHLSRSALRGWVELPRLVVLLEDLSASGRWAGNYLNWLISELRRYLSDSR